MNGPTGPMRADADMVQGEAFYVQRVGLDGAQNGTDITIFRKSHPFQHCDCSACTIRRLEDKVATLTAERDRAIQEHQEWLQDAWRRGMRQAGANKETLQQS